MQHIWLFFLLSPNLLSLKKKKITDSYHCGELSCTLLPTYHVHLSQPCFWVAPAFPCLPPGVDARGRDQGACWPLLPQENMLTDETSWWCLYARGHHYHCKIAGPDEFCSLPFSKCTAAFAPSERGPWITVSAVPGGLVKCTFIWLLSNLRLSQNHWTREEIVACLNSLHSSCILDWNIFWKYNWKLKKNVYSEFEENVWWQEFPGSAFFLDLWL